MRGSEAFLKAFLLLFISCASIFIISIGGSFAYEHVFKPEQRLAQHSMIASVQVGRLKQSEAEEMVQAYVNDWKRSATIELYFLDEILFFPVETLDYQIEASIEEALKTGYADISPKVSAAILEEVLQEIAYAEILPWLSLTKLKEGLEKELTSLASDSVSIDLNGYFLEEHRLTEDIVAQATIGPMDSSVYLQGWANALDGTVIEGRKLFSLLDMMEEKGQGAIKSEGLHTLTSAIYQAVLQTNFQVLERHIGRNKLDYVELGYDALAAPASMDFKFFNKNFYDYTLGVTFENQQLTVTITGIPFLHSYEIVTEGERVVEPRKIVQFSSNRRPGSSQVIRNGQDGYFVEVYRVTRGFNRELIAKEKIAEDYYPPVHQVIERGLQEPKQQAVEPDPLLDEFPWYDVPVEEGEPAVDEGEEEQEDAILKGEEF